MKIHTCDQGQTEWLTARVGKVTASELHNLLTPEFKQKTGETPKTYLYSKVAESWRGQPLAGFSGSWSTDQGNMREEEAIPWYALTYDCDIERVGFIEHDDGRCGGSPDGLIGDDGGIEVKCPEPVNHMRYLMEGVLPKDYVIQVHSNLYMSGRKWWKFLSYRRGFPPFVLTIQRDEEIMKKIHDALQSFYKQHDAAMAKLKQLQ